MITPALIVSEKRGTTIFCRGMARILTSWPHSTSDNISYLSCSVQCISHYILYWLFYSTGRLIYILSTPPQRTPLPLHHQKLRGLFYILLNRSHSLSYKYFQSSLVCTWERERRLCMCECGWALTQSALTRSGSGEAGGSWDSSGIVEVEGDLGQVAWECCLLLSVHYSTCIYDMSRTTYISALLYLYLSLSLKEVCMRANTDTKRKLLPFFPAKVQCTQYISQTYFPTIKTYLS